MKARVINLKDFGGVYSDEFLLDNKDNIVNGKLVSEWVLTDVLPNPTHKKPEWNGSFWYEAYVEVIEVPQEISRMKFEIQLYITTTVRDENNNIVQLGKTFQDIIDYIDSLQMSNFYKNLLKMRLLSCVTLERDNDDLNALAPGMGISQAQLDEIFIKGNTLQ